MHLEVVVGLFHVLAYLNQNFGAFEYLKLNGICMHILD